MSEPLGRQERAVRRESKATPDSLVHKVWLARWVLKVRKVSSAPSAWLVQQVRKVQLAQPARRVHKVSKA